MDTGYAPSAASTGDHDSHKHSYHILESKECSVTINNRQITHVDGKPLSDNTDFVSRTAIISDGPVLSNYQLYHTANKKCSPDCNKTGVPSRINEYSPDFNGIPLVKCKYDIENMKKPLYLGDAVNCYKLYRKMMNNNIKIAVFYFTKIDVLNITGYENILFDYICRIKKYETLIFVDDMPTDLSFKIPENARLYKNDRTELLKIEKYESASAQVCTQHMSVDSKLYDQVRYKLWQIVSPYEILYAFHYNNYESNITDYSRTSGRDNMVSYGFFGTIKKDSMCIMNVAIGCANVLSYNFTNDVSYNVTVPLIDTSSIVRYDYNIWEHTSLYLVIEDSVENRMFALCFKQHVIKFTIIFLCDVGKTPDVFGTKDNTDMIIYRDKNVEQYLK